MGKQNFNRRLIRKRSSIDATILSTIVSINRTTNLIFKVTLKLNHRVVVVIYALVFSTRISFYNFRKEEHALSFIYLISQHMMFNVRNTLRYTYIDSITRFE